MAAELGTHGGARFAPARVEVERWPEGGLLLRSPVAPRTPVQAVGIWLRHWAEAAPDRVFLAERAGGAASGWRELRYGEAARAVAAIGQALLDRGLSPERPIAVLAENGIDHALLALGAMEVGQPVAPISTAYARMSRDFGKLRHVLDLLRPELIYVDDVTRYESALPVLLGSGAALVASRTGDAPRIGRFADLLATRPTAAVEAAAAATGPHTIAKILFTSGSTDMPKGVINTQGMLCSNQEALAQVWPFVADRPPALVDWLPWSHTFGGNHDFFLVLRNGGSLHIDEGKPAPGLFDTTVANLRSVAPTLLFNVPRGYAFLLDALEADPAFNRHLFSRLDVVFYAAAALPQNLWTRLEACSRAARGFVVPMVSAWGMTETSPLATSVHFPIDRAGVIGLPVPGCEIRLAPRHGRHEMLVRGPMVTPGYFKDPARTAEAFDDGWLRTGDAVRWEDPAEPAKGLVFDGRVAENFKLTSATWVNVGTLRVAILAAVPLLADAVIAGHDRDEIGILGLPNVPACRALCPDLPADAAPEIVVAHPAVRAAVAAALGRHNRDMSGSSTAVLRAILDTEPPSIDAGEITDKGYINQRAVLTRRAALVGRLFAEPAGADVIRAAPAG